ncbi:heterokaryon incompatibility protein-domain-containing protein [Penicillium malachiteum]|uniref:heterokaryon incompatibility protein-domain-containing protein n=1 Tax=Penicillium malachiteum TaxID=1324776 RepID=UPI002546BE42|nr:heterokaryon incompatibility protein-domain-containing protein [Penicillium malachiteum]KAJ5714153.1 heterokaryon incompatibility protein-domain-containing protein [Penicillium malachiteum]
MPMFTYPSLQEQPHLTRMIRLLPHSRNDAPIECKLFNYNLSEGGGRAHMYEALSYCWQSNIRSETVILNECSLSITKNLHTALSYLRDRQLERILWIDAICINQDDSDEKCKQIPLMRMIYAQAGQVIVWLGDVTDNGDQALSKIQHLAEASCVQMVSNIAEDYYSCLKLLQRDWFHRIWV